MSVYGEPNSELSRQIEDAMRQGEQYKTAFLTLDPSLAIIAPDDTAVAFDIGRGAEGIAFKILGFRNAIITNSPSPLYQLAMPRSTQLEEEVYKAVQSHFPDHTFHSHLNVEEWLERQNFHPRLITMLKIAPQYFNEEDPLTFLQTFVQFWEQSKNKSTIILSALDDHTASQEAFIQTDTTLTQKGIPHHLHLDQPIPPPLQALGQRILVISR